MSAREIFRTYLELERNSPSGQSPLSEQNFELIAIFMYGISESVESTDTHPIALSLSYELFNLYPSENMDYFVACACVELAYIYGNGDKIRLEVYQNAIKKISGAVTTNILSDRANFKRLVVETFSKLNGRLNLPCLRFYLNLYLQMDGSITIEEVEFTKILTSIIMFRKRMYNYRRAEIVAATILLRRMMITGETSMVHIYTSEALMNLMSVIYKETVNLIDTYPFVRDILGEFFRSYPTDKFNLLTSRITTREVRRREMINYTTIPPGKVTKLIGRGSYGRVSVYTTVTGNLSVKLTNKFNSAYDEISSLIALNGHENIISLKAFSFTDISISYYMELGKNDLSAYTLKNASREMWNNVYIDCKPVKSVLSYSIRRNILRQVLSGLAHMHSYGIIHADIKPENILVMNDDWLIKIIDLGISQHYVAGQMERIVRSIAICTQAYRPIDLLLKINNPIYSTDADVWAMGVSMLELETRIYFYGVDTQTTEYMLDDIIEVLGPHPLHLSANIKCNKLACITDREFRLLLLQMLSYRPDSRITSRQALALVDNWV